MGGLKSCTVGKVCALFDFQALISALYFSIANAFCDCPEGSWDPLLSGEVHSGNVKFDAVPLMWFPGLIRN